MIYKVVKCNDFEIDGSLNDPQWEKTEKWEMELPENHVPELGPDLQEKGYVKMLHSEDFLYVGAMLEDTDVVQHGEKDQTALYLKGDTLELFFKPADDTYYWELYGTPNELKTSIFYPSRAYVDLPGTKNYVPEFEVKAHIDGTFNNWQTVDKGWSIEFKLPLRVFEQYGAKFRKGSKWQFLVGRQNFSKALPHKEISTFPKIKICHFHMLNQYGILEAE
ncbi:MAG: carbohydrate-binding family 9-like protein [Lentisphaeria bacterium]|nr:carbohydrate-binding family 9-like protein [Lentisphaeria bacterium]